MLHNDNSFPFVIFSCDGLILNGFCLFLYVCMLFIRQMNDGNKKHNNKF